MTRLALAIFTLALAGAVAHGAPATGDWSVLESDAAAGGVVALAGDGRVLSAGVACDEERCTTPLATRAPGEAFRPAGDVPGLTVAFAPLRDGGALLVTTPPERRRLAATDVTTTGSVVRSTVLIRRFAREAMAASNRDGTTAVAWLTNRLPQRLQVRSRERDGTPLGGREPRDLRARGRLRRRRRRRRPPRRDRRVLGLRRIARRPLPGAGRTPVRAAPARRPQRPRREGRRRLHHPREARDDLEQRRRRRGTGPVGARPRLDAAAGCDAVHPARSLGRGQRANRSFRPRHARARGGAGSTAMVAWTTASLRTRIAAVTARARSPVRARSTRTGCSSTPRVRLPPRAGRVDARPARRRRDRTGRGLPAGRTLRSRRAGRPAGSWATGAALDRAGTRALVTWVAGDPAIAPAGASPSGPCPSWSRRSLRSRFAGMADGPRRFQRSERRPAPGSALAGPSQRHHAVAGPRARPLARWPGPQRASGVRRSAAAVQLGLPGGGGHPDLPRARQGRRARAGVAGARGGQPVRGDPRPGLLPPVRDQLQPRRARQRGLDPRGRAVPGRSGARAGVAVRPAAGAQRQAGAGGRRRAERALGRVPPGTARP